MRAVLPGDKLRSAPEYADNLGRRFALGSYFDGSQAGPFAVGEGGSRRVGDFAGRTGSGFMNLHSSSFADVLASHAPGLLPGHGTDGHLPDLDWPALAKGSPTLVFYMALAHAEEIAVRLIAAGRSPHEPAALVSGATGESQTVQVTTLAELGAAAKICKAPAILVVGDNVLLREELDWFGAVAPA